MSHSKKNKDRAGKLEAFKKKAKQKPKIINMSNSNKQLVRKATWSSDEKFSISGMELQALSDFANFFKPMVDTATRILGQAELDGRIGFEYLYDDGSEVPTDIVEAVEKERLEKVEKKREEIEKYMKLLNEQREKVEKQMEKIPKEGPEDKPKMEVMK